MTEAIDGWAASQANASSSSVWPRAWRPSSRAATRRWLRSLANDAARSAGIAASRVPAGNASPALYLPVSIPDASGKNGRNAIAEPVARRDHVVERLAVEQAEAVLDAGEARPGLVARSSVVGGVDLGGREVARPDLADLAGGDELGERALRLLDRHRRVEHVLLVEVDAVGLQAAQRALDGLRDPRRAGAPAGGSPSNGDGELRADHDRGRGSPPASALPMIVSDAPAPPYTSAVSRKLIPASIAAWITAIEASSSSRAAEVVAPESDEAHVEPADASHLHGRRPSTRERVSTSRALVRLGRDRHDRWRRCERMGPCPSTCC